MRDNGDAGTAVALARDEPSEAAEEQGARALTNAGLARNTLIAHSSGRLPRSGASDRPRKITGARRARLVTLWQCA